MNPYDHRNIEEKWQQRWKETDLYRAPENPAKKYYCLIEFPYPSGDGLHVGHVRSYAAMDVIARKRRGEGYQVLYPIGWDAFGLPTENYAIKTGIHPSIVTKNNTDTFRRQLQSLGLSFDWSREINTSDPSYYRWTQWIFLKMYERGLAYKDTVAINWCPSCKIGLANEEVVAGRCERCGSSVEKREKEQWMLGITKYADRLDRDLDLVDFLPKIKTQQRNWIGRSEGAEIDFKISDSNDVLTVFTTRPDTLFGVTYLALAPEHPLVRHASHALTNKDAIAAYIEASAKEEEYDRTSPTRKKTGIILEGMRAINPASGEEIPVYTADYVLPGYGTGVVMGVPGHDARDAVFAKTYDIPVKIVIEPVTGTVQPEEEFRRSIVAVVRNPKTDEILLIDWGSDNGGKLFVGGGIDEGEDLEAAARREIQEETGYKNLALVGTSETIHHHYRAHSKGVNRCIQATGLYFELQNEDQSAVALEVDEEGKFKVLWSSSQNALRFVTDELHAYVFRKLVVGEVYGGAGLLINSDSWNGKESESSKSGITEAVQGRMVTRFKLRDWVFSRQRYWGEPIPMVHCPSCGIVPLPESELPLVLPDVEAYKPTDTGESPLAAITSWVNTTCPRCTGPAKRETDVMPTWAGSSWYYIRYIDPRNTDSLADRAKLDSWLPVDWYNGGMEHTTLHLLYSRFWHKFLFDIGVVPTSEPYQKRTSQGMVLAEDGEKMSKSKGNVINPDQVVKDVGADTLRLYELFMGPFDQPIPWSTDSLVGQRRFIERIWKLASKTQDVAVPDELERERNRIIQKVSEDIEGMRFNTALSALMVFSNKLQDLSGVPREAFATLVRLLAPFAPHVAEELWEMLGTTESVHSASWPSFDPQKTGAVEVTIAIQINGKMRSQVVVPAGTSQTEVHQEALALPEVVKWIGDTEPRKVVFVPDRILNIVL